METWGWIVLVDLAAAVAVVVLGAVASRRRRRLGERFGPEYQRASRSSGRRDADRRLSEVESEHEELNIRSLPRVSRERFLEEWRQAESRFVSDPCHAALTAERLVKRVLEERGYPVVVDRESQIAHVAADYPDLAERLRHGRAMIENVGGSPAAEDLRTAMVDFRIVLDELLGEQRAAA